MKNEKEVAIAYVVEGTNYAILEESEYKETVSERVFGLFKKKILRKIDKVEENLAMSAAKAKYKGEFEEYGRIKRQLQEIRKIKIMIERDSYEEGNIRKRVIMVSEIITVLTKVLTFWAWVGTAGIVLNAGTVTVLPVAFIASLGLLTLLLIAVVIISAKLKDYYLGRIQKEAFEASVHSIMRKVDKKAKDETALYEISKKVDKYKLR